MGIDAEMVVRVKRPIADEEISRISYDMVAAFGTEHFFIWDDSRYSSSVPVRRVLTRVSVYEQDGPDVAPEPGETLLEVSLSGRYYGVDYERGDLPTLIMLAEYLERKIPGSTVCYGGDSSGICLEPFGKTEREALFAHFVEYGHKPYQSYFDRPMSGDANPLENPVCDFCNRRMIRNGWGGALGGYGAFYCPGCGQARDTHDHGVTWRQTAEVGGHEPREVANRD